MEKKNNIIIQLTDLDEIKLAILKHSNWLPDDILSQAERLGGKRKLEFLAGRFLLAHLLKRYFGINRLPTIEMIDNAKPTFIDRTLPNFNISHSGGKIAVAITSQNAVGLDIEKQRLKKNRINIARYCFSQKERQWVKQQPNRLTAFWKLWTCKEAALKLDGKGVWQMKQINIDPQSWRVLSAFSNDFYCYYQQIDLVHLALCCQAPITRLTLRIGKVLNSNDD